MFDQVMTSTVNWVVPFVLGGGAVWATAIIRGQRQVVRDVADIKVLMGGYKPEPGSLRPAQPGLIEVIEDVAMTLRQYPVSQMSSMLSEHGRLLDQHAATLGQHGLRLDRLDPPSQ